jgi:DNA-binding CsgD family transcriptional regulator
VLDGVGLTDDQQSVYVALVEVASATVADLRLRSPGSRVPDALCALERMGLISRLPGTPARYAAAPPDAALDLLIRGRERDLASARLASTELAARYRAARLAADPHQVVEVVTTRDATLRRWEQLQRSARHQVRSFDRPPYVSDPAAGNPIESELLAAGVTYRCVYHADGFALPGRPESLRALIAAGEQVRVALSVPVKMFIADDTLGLLPLEVDGSAESCLVIHASSMLDTLIALFEQVWDRAVAIHPDGTLPAEALPGRSAEPSDADRALLGLLAAGLTDAAIARQLGMHPRTVQHRVRDLLDRLGAATRFQAGLQAARRGWLLQPGPPRAWLGAGPRSRCRSRNDRSVRRQKIVTVSGAEAIPLATTTSVLRPVGVPAGMEKRVEDLAPGATDTELQSNVRA